jgi:hypothetical protein
MACHVYEFEQAHWTRDVLDATMHSLIKHGDAEYRDTFHTVASAVLSAKKLQQIKFPGYIVYPGRDGYVHIRARQTIVGNICPKCGKVLKHDKLRLIQVAKECAQQDLPVWGCMACCTVFSRWEDKRESTGVPDRRSLLRPGNGRDSLVPGRRMD